METIPNNGEYVAPEINVIEIKSLGVLCASSVGSGNGGYTPTDYPW